MSPDGEDKGEPWLVPGRNCWRVETAGRFAVLMENQAYFDALRSSLNKAQKSIVVTTRTRSVISCGCWSSRGPNWMCGC
jgi:hypothetical protein